MTNSHEQTTDDLIEGLRAELIRAHDRRNSAAQELRKEQAKLAGLRARATHLRALIAGYEMEPVE